MTESRFLDPEDEAFNEIERRSVAKKDAVKAQLHMKEELTKLLTDSYDQGIKDGLETVLQLIKELRPAIKPLDSMGKGITTQEWFDILAGAIKEKNG
jgi:hypothetical protein